MAATRVRSHTPSSAKTRVCSRCHQEKPTAEFVGVRPGAAEFEREFKTCGRCRVALRELARAKAAELVWLREEAPVPYEERRRRRR